MNENFEIRVNEFEVFSHEEMVHDSKTSKCFLVRRMCMQIMLDLFERHSLPFNMHIIPATYRKGMYEVHIEYLMADELLVEWFEERTLNEEAYIIAQRVKGKVKIIKA